jgi:hypothetical protein
MLREKDRPYCIYRITADMKRAARNLRGTRYGYIPMLLLVGALGILAAACSSATAPTLTNDHPATAAPVSMQEYVSGHWIPFTSAKTLTSAQWAVVNTYANFSSAALAVYSTRSVDPLVTVVSPQSKVTGMFTRFLAEGKNPEALYTKATVESVAIHGCRATLTLELYYPGGRTLHYVSSWVRPFNRAALGYGSHRTTGSLALASTNGPGSSGPSGGSGQHSSSATKRAVAQYAPWLFVGDNRVGGVDTPCGI